MVNREQVYDVPLVGKGLSVKARRGPFAPGEFRVMRNCEILEDGSIRNRRPIWNIPAADSGSNVPTSNAMLNINTGFIGHYRSSVLSGGKLAHKWYGSTATFFGEVVKNLWSPADMNVLGHSFDSPTSTPPGTDLTKITDTSTDWRQIVGFFRYNKKVYWIVQSYIQSRVTDGKSATYIHILYKDDPINGDLTTITFSGLSVALALSEDLSTIISDIVPGRPYGDPQYTPGIFPHFKRAFLFKERLWLITQKTVYASAPTLPEKWSTADDGFFANFNEAEINDAVGVKDSVYIVCDNRIYVLTYNKDLNNPDDMTVRLIADGQGGDSCVLHKGTVYFVRDDSLFSLSDLNLTKIRELDFFDDNNPGFPKNYTWRLVVFGNYIIALARSYMKSSQSFYTPANATRYPVGINTEWKKIPEYMQMCMTSPGGVTSDLSPSVSNSAFFINMDNGAVHSFDSTAWGFLQDVYFNPMENALDGQQQLFLMNVAGPYSSSGNKSGHWVYTMTSTQDDVVENYSYDKIFNSSSNAVYQGFVTDLEFWVDLEGDEFWVKRFRQILIEGSVCKNMSIVFAFDNENFTAPTTLNETVSEDQPIPVRAPYQMRVGINQKSRLLIVRIYKPYADVIHSPLSSENLSYMMINKIQLLFTQSARGPQRHFASMGRD